MRIESVRAWHLHHAEALLVEDGTTPPLPPGAKGRRQLAVELRTDEGPRGLAVGYAPPGAREVVDEVLAGVLVGQDPRVVGELWAEMMWAVRDFGRGGVALQAISAADLALWDLKARVEGLPVFRLLGELRPSIIVYGSGGFTSTPVPELEEEMRAFVAAGFGAVKMMVGTGFGTREILDSGRLEPDRAGMLGAMTRGVCQTGAAESRRITNPE